MWASPFLENKKKQREGTLLLGACFNAYITTSRTAACWRERFCIYAWSICFYYLQCIYLYLYKGFCTLKLFLENKKKGGKNNWLLFGLNYKLVLVFSRSYIRPGTHLTNYTPAPIERWRSLVRHHLRTSQFAPYIDLIKLFQCNRDWPHLHMHFRNIHWYIRVSYFR